MIQPKKGFANIGNAQIHYETAGQGMPFIMIHAGVTDSRQWNNEFGAFAKDYHVVRYDQRCYGQSEPVEGEFSHLGDLTALLKQLKIEGPLILMGCSMGGGPAVDFALANPSKVRALIMVDSGPGGLELDVPDPPKYAEAEKAFEAKDFDLLAELETQIWFDGQGRNPGQVNPEMRILVYEMDRRALDLESIALGKRLPNRESPAVNHLDELKLPVLVVVGELDTTYMLAVADFMLEKIPSARKIVIKDAAHLPNLEHPQEFQRIIKSFLDEVVK